jgi:predicted RNase H-like HicB family nuclease
MKLQVIIEKDETGYYVAEVPALPGCFSQGKTIAEVTINIKEAIEGWIEVMNEKTKTNKYSLLNKNSTIRRIAVTV